MNGLQDFLRSHSRVALDTSVFIYALEANPKYVALATRLFDWIERPGHAAVTSTLTMTELLVQPYRGGGERRVDAVFALFSTYPHLEWVAPDLGTADMAARLRANHRLATPDALQAATALRLGATALVTNDKVFRRVEGFECLVLDEVLAHP